MNLRQWGHVWCKLVREEYWKDLRRHSLWMNWEQQGNLLEGYSFGAFIQIKQHLWRKRSKRERERWGRKRARERRRGILLRLSDMKVKSDHRSKFSNLSNWKEEAWKNQGFNGIRTRDHRVAGVMLYQELSYEATHWERGQFIEFISSRTVKWCEVYMK